MKRRIYASESKPIMAADDDIILDDDINLDDTVDDLADTVEDIQDAVQEDPESYDGESIAAENNITNHYIAECDRCGSIFISAVVETDQDIDHVSGTCPICQKDSDQYLKWVIKDVDKRRASFLQSDAKQPQSDAKQPQPSEESQPAEGEPQIEMH